MKTSKPFSNISYNTDAFMRQQVERLIKAHVLSFACWIRHEPDTDDKKTHIHVYFVPSKLMQTDDLIDEFKEIDPNNPLPLGLTAIFRNSKFDDWYLYGLHDKKYLMKKGLTRNVHYTRSNMRCTDEDAFNNMIQDIDLSDATTQMIIDVAEHKMTMGELVRNGRINLRDVRNFENAVNAVRYDTTDTTKARQEFSERKQALYDDILHDNSHMQAELATERLITEKQQKVIARQNDYIKTFENSQESFRDMALLTIAEDEELSF